MFRYTYNKILEILTKCLKTLFFFPHRSFITFAHVHRATNAQGMSGLHVFSSSPCIVWHCRVDTQNIAFNTNILLRWR